MLKRSQKLTIDCRLPFTDYARGFSPTPEHHDRKPVDEWSGNPKGIFESHGRKSVVWGFTIIELVVSVAIIVTAFTTIFSLMIFTLKASRISKDELIATNLAQEGIELVRNIRDSQWNFCNDWLENDAARYCSTWDYLVDDGTGNFGKIEANQSYIIINPPLHSGGSNENRAYLAIGDSTLFKEEIGGGEAYVHEGTKESSFSRQITFDELSDEKVLVISTVSWQGGTVTIKEYLYNWYTK